MQTKQRAVAFELKSLAESGEFSGYGSVFGVVDSYNEVVVPGAFAASLAEWQQKGRMPAMLWQHRPSEPIGRYTRMAEDGRGLYVEGQLALKTRRGSEAYELLKMGALSGLSIGFLERKYEVDKESQIRRLTDLDLWEVSLVTFPANDDARVSDVKAAIRRGEIPDIRSLEAELRDVLGLSQKQAKALLACGYRGLAERDVDDDARLAAKRLVQSIMECSK